MLRGKRLWYVLSAFAVIVVALGAIGVWWFRFREPDVARFGSEEPGIVVIGDSYTSGFGENETSWPELLAAGSGETIASAAVPMSGYAVPERPFADQLERVSDLSPETVVIAGSRNDQSRADQFPGAAVSLWREAASAFPESRIVVVGPMWDATEAPDAVRELDDRMAQAASDAGITYVSGVDWLAGQADMMQADDMHPNDEAQRILAERFEVVLGL